MRRMLLRTCLSTCKLLNVRLEESNKVNARAHMFVFERNMWGKNMETGVCCVWVVISCVRQMEKLRL